MSHRERLLKTFLDLAVLPSPSFAERPVAEYVRAALTAAGVDVREDEAGRKIGGNSGNLIAVIPGRGEPLLLAAHLDTVPLAGTVRPVVDGDVVRSSGDTILGADDKSAVAVLIELARLLRETGASHRPLELVFTVAEEAELLGAKSLDCSALTARSGYALDGAEPGQVVRAAPSKISFDITIRGRGGHATKPADTINPIRVAAEAIVHMPQGQIDAETTGNVGVVNAGSAVNVVPEAAHLLVEIRSHNEGKLAFFADQVTLAVEQASAAARLLTEEGVVCARSEIRRARCYDAFRVDESDPLVRQAMAAIREAGLEPKVVVGAGGLDANVFNARGIRCVGLGTGAHRPHTTREYLSIPEMLKSLEVLLHLVRAP